MMSLGRIYALVLRQYYLLRGSPARLLSLFVWVAVDIVLWGFITRYLTEAAPAARFVPMLLGAVLLWDFLTRVMHGMTSALFEDIWSRNFLNIFATPLTVAEYIGSLTATTVATSAVGLAVMLALATGVFGLSFLASGAALAGFIFVLFLTGIALGVLGAAIVLKLGPSSEWFIWPIPALMSPFVCVFYPQSTLPQWMQAVSYALPPSYVFESMRALAAGGAAADGALLTGLGLAVFFLLLACAFFSRVFRQALRTGLIARYSAETVT